MEFKRIWMEMGLWVQEAISRIARLPKARFHTHMFELDVAENGYISHDVHT